MNKNLNTNAQGKAWSKSCSQKNKQVIVSDCESFCILQQLLEEMSSTDKVSLFWILNYSS